METVTEQQLTSQSVPTEAALGVLFGVWSRYVHLQGEFGGKNMYKKRIVEHFERCFWSAWFGISSHFKWQEIKTYYFTLFFFFKDPYESGYGVVKHIRSVSEDDQIFCNFLTEKSRVVFLKSMSFSRLELTATKYQPVYLQCGNQSCHLYW